MQKNTKTELYILYIQINAGHLLFLPLFNVQTQDNFIQD